MRLPCRAAVIQASSSSKRTYAASSSSSREESSNSERPASVSTESSAPTPTHTWHIFIGLDAGKAGHGPLTNNDTTRTLSLPDGSQLSPSNAFLGEGGLFVSADLPIFSDHFRLGGSLEYSATGKLTVVDDYSGYEYNLGFSQTVIMASVDAYAGFGNSNWWYAHFAINLGGYSGALDDGSTSIANYTGVASGVTWGLGARIPVRSHFWDLELYSRSQNLSNLKISTPSTTSTSLSSLYPAQSNTMSQNGYGLRFAWVF